MINIFGVVGEDVRAADVITKIQAEKDKVLDVNIMSIGGNVREGMAIYDALREASANGQEVRTFAIGITASIASIIFMAGDVREVSDNAEIMIHNASVVTGGNKHDLKGAIETLDGMDSQMIDIYTSRTELSAEEVAGLLDKETFMTADEAVSKGFATAKTDALALVAMINKKKEPVNMAEENKEEAKSMFNKLSNLLFGKEKAQEDPEKEEPDTDAKAEGDDEDKPDFEAENVALKAENEALKAKAKEDDDEREEAKAKAEEEKAKALKHEDEEEKENEAKAHLIFDAMTSDKITKFEAKNLLNEPLEFVNKTLKSRIVNHTGGAKTDSPSAEPKESCKAIWKEMQASGNHGEAQAYYEKHSDAIAKEKK